MVPFAGLGIVMLADKLGFLPPGDKMFRFVLLLQHTMPTSVLSGNNHILTSQCVTLCIFRDEMVKPRKSFILFFFQYYLGFLVTSLHLNEHSHLVSCAKRLAI